jgi:hypothetical protein
MDKYLHVPWNKGKLTGQKRRSSSRISGQFGSGLHASAIFLLGNTLESSISG